MSGYTPQAGHRVRVTEAFEGTYGLPSPVNLSGEQPTFSLTRSGDGDVVSETRFFYRETLCQVQRSFERLLDPEPEWQKADVARDGNGNTLVRRHPGAEFEWRNAHNEDVYRDSEVTRPLTPLVRNGKPWAEA